jgi:dihydroflavonol-4-reductase
MRQLIITGGTGHIGVNLVYLLNKNNQYKIKLLLLPGEDISMFKGMDIEFSYGNILDIDYLMSEISEDSIVIHMAGYINISSHDIQKMYKVNYEGTKNICDVCLKKKVYKLIYTSSVHAIIPAKKNISMREPTFIDEKLIIGDYGKSKALATKYVFSKIKEGLPGVVLYPSGVIGPKDYKVSDFGSVIIDIANNKLKAKVRGSYNFVDVRDVASGIESAITKGEIGKGYILSGENITVDQIYQVINKYLNQTHHIPTLPIWFVRSFAKLAELYYTRRHKKPLFTKYSLYTITANHNFDNTTAKEYLDFKTRDIKISLIDSLVWFQKNMPALFKLSTD